MSDFSPIGADLIPPASWVAERAAADGPATDAARRPTQSGVGPLVQLCLALMAGHPGLRRLAYRTFFQVLARRSQDAAWWTCMNYGYAPCGCPPGDAPMPPRAGPEEAEHTSLQLYDHVVAAVPLAGREVLEVSCGRGGGAAFLCRRHGAARVTGLDVAEAAIAFCRRVHRLPGLFFTQGDAENLPFGAETFDAVVNVEASFCYGDFDRFLAEAYRVLRPGGHLLFADLRLTSEVGALRRSLARSGFALQRSEDITRNVLRALEIDSERRVRACDRSVPWPLRGLMRFFVGAAGTRIPLFLADGRMRYLCFVLRKAARPAAARAA